MKIGLTKQPFLRKPLRTRRPRRCARSTALTASTSSPECLDREIAGKYTIDDLGAWFADPKHHLKMLSYNALIFFNMKQTQEEKDAVMAKAGSDHCRLQQAGLQDDRCCSNPWIWPFRLPLTRSRLMLLLFSGDGKEVEPHGIKLSIEFCGALTMSINRFEYAYDIVTEVDHPLVGITLDQYHFHAMASGSGLLSRRLTARRFSYGT